ncbi:ABC transporter substrate-binding protein [Acidisphaera sp. L21]|uniref:ABC transporter substrate-binding protein n=1 Tax=Acidisphaera sp. L21 TaxID=1641851 RepID=UPI00131CE868|nr:ABC transporter substrate-binding protein [Acidisphaera sp. L21]
MRAFHWAVIALLSVGSAHAQGVLRIGLQDDPDALDPARGGTFAGRLVFASVCDKLVDTNPALDFVPQLATAWSWSADGLTLTMKLREGVHFQDGTVMDAEAVRANLERYRTAPNSARKAELKPVASITVADPQTVQIHLTQRYAPLLAVLSDRAGMMLSPVSFADGKSPDVPICAGPFHVTERVAQDHITVERFAGYWNAPAIHFDRIIYRPIHDSTVRLVNLQTGQLDMIEEMAPSDVAAARGNPHLRLSTATSLGYETISINVGHGAGAENPLGHNATVRKALELAIDRNAINQVVMDGQFVPANQAELPGSKFWNPDIAAPARDPAAAKALLKQAGFDKVAFTLQVTNTPRETQLGEVIQAMVADAGFDMKVQPLETNTLIDGMNAGNYNASVVVWSGRADPDANISLFLACDGFQNWGKYCDPAFDALLTKARASTDPAERQSLYRQVAAKYLQDRPNLVLFHMTWLFAASDKLQGFVPTPDGLIRPQGLHF